MTPLNTTLVEQFLHVSGAVERPHGRCPDQKTQGKAVVKPEGVRDDRHRRCSAQDRGSLVTPAPAFLPRLAEAIRTPAFQRWSTVTAQVA